MNKILIEIKNLLLNYFSPDTAQRFRTNQEVGGKLL